MTPSLTSHRPLLCLLMLCCAIPSCSRKESKTISTMEVSPLDVPSIEDANPDLPDADTDASMADVDPWETPRANPLDDLPKLDARPDTWRRGISLGLFASEADPVAQRAIYVELLDEIVAVGATDLSLVVRWSQESIADDVIAPKEGVTVPDALVKEVIQEARSRGLRVFLMPIIWLEQRKMGVWRGTMSPRDPDAWWESYTRFIHHYADLAQESDVTLLSVGSELLSMESEEARWRKLIASVRERYEGELTYSANWDHFEVPAFWDALDVVGLTAYQELTKTPNPTVEELEQGWSSFSGRLRRWAAEHDHHYIFTEVGYPSHREGAAYPWNYSANAPAAPWLQARSYRAMMQKWSGDRRLDGLYVWNWFGFKDLEDRGYTPRGKPAEKIVEHWYKTTRGADSK